MKTAFLLLALVATDGWQSYGNARFGYTAEYPAKLLKALPEAENGDGRHFKARQGSADFAMWGQYLTEGTTFADNEQLAEADCRDHHATYKLQKPAVWVISCPLPDGGILYSKGLRRKDAASRFEARYPAAEKGVWDAVAARMAASLTAPHPAE